MDKRSERYLKVYPWYAGFSSDLLFYIAVDSLFLTVVKNFSASEIVSVTSLSQLICIALQFPVLFIIKRIGNTASVRMGGFFMLLSAVLITLAPNYGLVLLGRVFHDVAAIFNSASVVALENNLDMLGRRGEFVRFRTRANTVYAVITMLISFVAGAMFNLHHHLPMIGCIATCTTGFLLSLRMKDCSDYNRIPRQKRERAKVRVRYSGVVILAIVLFGLFYTLVANGQNEGKLFIQQKLLLDFNVDQTSLILAGIICFSRIVRVVSNVIFVKLYRKYREKMGVALPTLLCTSIGLMLFGSFIPTVMLKILVMGLGYTIILFIRDPFKLYIQDVLFAHTPKEQHQTLLTVMEFGVKIATAGIGLAFSALLLRYPMLLVIGIMFAIGLAEIVLSIILYRAIVKGKARAAA